MMRIAAFVVLVLGASAKVPHWAKPKMQLPAFKMPSLMTRTIRRLEGHTTGGSMTPEMIEAMIPEECKTACPGVGAMMGAMMGAMSGGRRLEGHEGGDDMPDAASRKIICENIDTLECAQAEGSPCSALMGGMGSDDEGSTGDSMADGSTGSEEDDGMDMGMMKCMCACPSLMEMMGGGGGPGGRRLDGHEGGDDDMPSPAEMKKMCAADGPVKCLQAQSACAPALKQPGMDQMPVACKMNDLGCMQKMGDTCATFTKTMDTDMCDKKAETGEDLGACCTSLKGMVDCMGNECMALIAGGPEQKEAAGYRKGCPDAGVPTEAEVKEVMKKAAAGPPDSAGSAGSAATAAPAAKVVKVAFKVDGLEYDKMDAITKTALKTTLTEMMAQKFGVDRKYVEVSLSSGSVKVDAKIKATEAGVDPSKVKQAAGSISPAAIIETVKKVPNIEKAATGGSLDNISVTTPVATEETADSSEAGAGDAAAGATSVQAMSAVFVVSTLAALM